MKHTVPSKKLFMLCLLMLVLSVAEVARAEAQCDQQPIIGPLVPGYPYGAITGSATLCATPVGLKAEMRAADLVPGHAYTVWWIYIDAFPECYSQEECDYKLFFADDPAAVVGRMDSAVADKQGRAHFSDAVQDMAASSGSEVWLFIMHHEEANESDGRALARQLLTPEDPVFGAPHMGIVGGPLAWPAASTFHVLD